MALDHYNTLGVIPTASAADLRTAYLKLARANHPDKFDGAARAEAEARMQQINEAWNVLGIAHKRREYDAKQPHDRGAAGASTQQQAGQKRRGHAHFRPFLDDDGMVDGVDIDLDARPMVGSRGIPRWVTFLPVGLFVFGMVTLAFGTMVNATAVFALGLVAVAFGGVCFLLLPLIVMSRAERDPDL